MSKEPTKEIVFPLHVVEMSFGSPMQFLCDADCRMVAQMMPHDDREGALRLADMANEHWLYTMSEEELRRALHFWREEISARLALKEEEDRKRSERGGTIDYHRRRWMEAVVASGLVGYEMKRRGLPDAPD